MWRLVLLSCGILAFAVPAFADTYVVNPDGTGDFPTIQAAVDYVQDGDIIELADGVFRGDGNRDVDYLGKDIAIRSQSGDPRTCVVDCEGVTEEHRGFIFENVSSDAVLEGITIRNGLHAFGGAVYCGEGASPRMVRCIFERNFGQYGGGIYCDVLSSPSISGCTFEENWAGNMGGGICI